MANPRILTALEREYARLLGEYEAAELAIEPIVGLAAVEAADREIAAHKAALRIAMDRVSLRIRVEFDAMWAPYHLRPLKPRVQPRYGQTRAAYKALKAARAPRTAHELAREIAPQFGIRPTDNRMIAKLASAMTVSFKRHLDEGLVVSDGGQPIRWSVHEQVWRHPGVPACAASAPLVRVADRRAGAKPGASPNTPLTQHQGARWSLLQAPPGTADRC